jgi:hypothetical protein
MYRCGRKEISLGSGKVWVWAAWNIDDDQVIAVPVSSTRSCFDDWLLLKRVANFANVKSL